METSIVTLREQPPSRTVAIEARELTRNFDTVRAVDNASFTVPERGRLGLLGPSGSGKSTLLSIIAGLDSQDTGTISIGGGDTQKERLAKCALMPQRDMLFPWRSAIENACIALENMGMKRSEARKQARPLFERAGLASFEDSPITALSGGMRQRVAFLRTMLANKDVLLLDEPFGALDSIVRAQMQEWLLGVLKDTPQTLVLVTHDVEEALYLCDQIIVLSARPARVALRLDVDHPQGLSRRETIAHPTFITAKDRILEALEC